MKPEVLISLVEHLYGLEIGTLRAGSRKSKVTYYRQLAMALCIHRSGMAQVDIDIAFDKARGSTKSGAATFRRRLNRKEPRATRDWSVANDRADKLPTNVEIAT